MRLSLASLAAAAVVIAVSAPALADTTILNKTDPVGDVRLSKHHSPISDTKRKSIDMDKATIRLLDNGKYRFRVYLKKVYTSSSWDQFVTFTATGGNYGVVDVGFRVRNSSGAYAYDEVTGDQCALKVVRDGRTVSVDVPAKCAPADEQEVRVDSYTGHWQSDENPYSHDHAYMGIFRY